MYKGYYAIDGVLSWWSSLFAGLCDKNQRLSRLVSAVNAEKAFRSFLVLTFSYLSAFSPCSHWVPLSFVPFGWHVMVVFRMWVYAMIVARVQISASGIQVDVKVVMYYETSSSTFSSEESFEYFEHNVWNPMLCALCHFEIGKNTGDLLWRSKPWKECFDLPFLSGCSMWTDVILTCSQWSGEQT